DLIEGAHDNGAVRVATKIHGAVRRLRGSDSPRVLVLVNDDGAADKFDLRESLAGFLRYGGEPISTLPPSAHQRMLEARSEIDLYVWLDESSDERTQFVSVNAVGRNLRALYFDGGPLGRAA